MPVTINASTSTGLVQSADTSGVIELQTNGTTVATVNTSNNVQFRSAISVGNATPTTSGAGITFPATQSASTDANTLDDYEEGTWTPSYTFLGGGSVTQTITSGRYTKIGNVVNLFCRIATASLSSPTGTAVISGLPFTSASGSNYGVAIGQASGFAVDVPIRAQIEPSSTTIDILKNQSGAAALNLQGSDFASGANKNLLDLTLTYRAA